MYGVVDRWNGKNLSGLVIKSFPDGEDWVNCEPALLKNLLDRGLKVGDEVWYEKSERYKKKVVKLWFAQEYREHLARVNKDQLPKEEVKKETGLVLSVEDLPYEERVVKLLERIAVALEYNNKIYRGV